MSEDSILEVSERMHISARKGADPETRRIDGITATIDYGKMGRQGDVYLKRLTCDRKLVKGLRKTDNPQLVPGTSIGSRHTLRMDRGEEIYLRKNPSPLQGPIIYAPNGFYLEHPKHADFDCRLPGVYEVTFPADKVAEELGEIRRRID